jgi:streptogramin lyase
LAGNVDGKGAAARFYYPSAIVSGPDGNLFVTSGSTIVKVTLDGVATKFAGSKNLQGNTDGPLTSALFSYPSGLAMGLDGTLFVADKGNYVVRAVASDGIVSTPKNLSTKGQPVFLSIDPNGIMCLTYKSGNIISLRGTKNSVIQDFLPAELSSPSGVVACAPNEFYVADRLTHKIYKIQFKY